jgi:hypothetical protein
MRNLPSPFNSKSPFGNKKAPESLAVFTAGPTLEEIADGLIVTPGVEVLSITGLPIYALTGTPGNETLQVEVAFP